MLAVVNSNGNPYFRSRYHINRSLVIFECFKYFPQETCCQQHTSALDLDRRNVILGSYSLDLAFFSSIRNQGTRSIRLHCIQQANRDIIDFSRQDTSRMQDLRPEISQFCRFFEMQMTNRRRSFYESRIVIVHTIDICPDLYLFCLDSRTNQRSCIVATAALQVIDLTVCVSADITLRNIQVSFGIFFQQTSQFFFDVDWIRFSILVCTHKIECRKQY